MIISSIYTLISTLCFGIIFNIKGKNLIFAALGGGFSWYIYLLTSAHHSNYSILPFFITSVIVSIYSEIMARILKTPVTTFVICAIIPLVPGGGMYNTMFQFIQGNTNESLNLGLQTLSIAGAVAIGVFFVSSTSKLIALIRRNFKAKVGSIFND
ncbi:threonine/serine exporter family protein [Clostridiaceae bacterium UIB06]|uniref:Threonine/serine exporter family protein n=1 Tax=Clostridium thailandense TaxID=2794346 RepID=A0A949TS94_9CLOT|nr:threonine/serine exporter family protein [Clostridium thailandense]MBV7274437.1 threonine/serine exporter family protein [Clostridium thailandense]MCH5136623.1 threonine/serine exporter family protein [Clostridiaceae bacterium UIB06]